MRAWRAERDLVRRMLAGDEAAFERFADDYLPVVYRFASSRLGGDREVTREVVQETMAKAIARISSFRGEAALATWLCACCRNEIAGHFRRAKKHWKDVEIEDVEERSAGLLEGQGPEGTESGVLRRERARRVHAVLDSLPPHYGKALEWKYLEELSVAEVADRLNLGPKAAESLLTRARRSFRDGYARLAGAEGAIDAGPRLVDRRMGFQS